MKDDSAIQNLCLHTHNKYCDGKEDINTLIKNAVNQGVTQIGISSHAPIKKENNWSMDLEQLDNYQNDMKKAKAKYNNLIAIFCSLEIDFIPDYSYTFDFFKHKIGLDYTIGSIHLVAHPESKKLWFIDGDKKECEANMNRIFDNNVRYAVESFFQQTRQMISSQNPDIIGHLDKVIMNTAHLFDSSAAWYQEEITRTLFQIKKYNVIVEVNTRGLYKGKWSDTFPSKEILQKCFEMDIPITISSDAHHSDELLFFYDTVRSDLKKMGFKYISGRNKGKWGNFPI